MDDDGAVAEEGTEGRVGRSVELEVTVTVSVSNARAEREFDGCC